MTIEGKTANIVIADTGYGRFPAVIVDLETNGRAVKVYIAPGWHLNNKKIELKKEQFLTISG